MTACFGVIHVLKHTDKCNETFSQCICTESTQFYGDVPGHYICLSSITPFSVNSCRNFIFFYRLKGHKMHITCHTGTLQNSETHSLTVRDKKDNSESDFGSQVGSNLVMRLN